MINGRYASRLCEKVLHKESSHKSKSMIRGGEWWIELLKAISRADQEKAPKSQSEHCVGLTHYCYCFPWSCALLEASLSAASLLLICCHFSQALQAMLFIRHLLDAPLKTDHSIFRH
ncbi:uncharacterized protein ASCRUDRAFT_143960 [Ascoidea rubescens DSM 1968]|uniref:Uncharacterized protein n=1 Tax=Ascoidea rubescens DSM 1968 TaxID=1344418 RepID=A0A1D2VJA7_9ASCO|nr:hypothetical protein ASCRUDRAFT_143960 [Ascoidea rubescens DSM 1968]ODV61650.1 hypothetical protein ASCRUDRAFT_143960 [Ascoidea rubescens DSM 1968]